jgi:hypothetical protein
MDANMMGLGASAFWLFIAAVVVAGIWSSTREKEAKQQILKDIISKSETLDDQTVEKLMKLVERDTRQDAASTKQGLEIAYRITGAVAVGLVILGLMVGAFMEMLGVGGLVACVSYGLYLAAGSIVVEDEPEMRE